MLKLGNHVYEITKVDIHIEYMPSELISIDLVAESKDESLDLEMREIELQADFVSLDLFITKHIEINLPHGLTNTAEFEQINKSTLDILNIDKFNKNITLHWYGLCNINWNREFNENVPFDVKLTSSYN